MVLEYNLIIIIILIIVKILLYRLYRHYKNDRIEAFEALEIANSQYEPKIAFLFLTYNNLKRPDIWNKFFAIDTELANETKSIDNTSDYSNKFSIYNHAKEKDKVTDLLLSGRHISEHIDTCWGCFGTVEANILMMKEALKDPLNKKFILVSDSCAPLVSFNKLYKEVMKDNKSNVNFLKTNNTTDRYDSIIDPSFPKSDFKKHCAQGLIINRTYAEMLINSLNEYKDKWKNMTCVDEHYFGNLLKVLDPNFNVNTNQTNITFDMWQSDKINYKNLNNDDIKPDHYVNLKKLSNKGIDRIREHDFIFSRKIDKDTEIDIDYLLQ